MAKIKREYKYVFGPVPSRRLGRSLGVDVVPFKTCSYDCIYCQLGKTTEKTVIRNEFIPVADIILELKQKLEEDGQIDYITLSGSGEPTLYSKLGELIRQIKQITKVPAAVLTNGSLLWDQEVQQDLKDADLIIPSLDAGSEDVFRYVNRPTGRLSFKKVVSGLIDFSAKYHKKIWLEVLLLNGVSAIRSEILKLNEILKKINPSKIQLNTVLRPPAETFAFSVPAKQIMELSKYFTGDVEVISNFTPSLDQRCFSTTKEEILNLLGRRPCSLDDIAGGLNLHKNEIVKYLEELVKTQHIVYREYNHVLYYFRG